MKTPDDFYTPENANLDCRYEVVSPSGHYRLVVTPYTTTEGGWNYTQGLVFRQGSDVPLAEIRRNYSAFPATFIENHPSGHQFLVAGADYQGQTVIELDTGRRRDFLPEEAKDGFGFCWAAHRFDPATKMLIVDGCIWAAPYEYRFYDFSDPMEDGWPALDFEGAYAEDKWPEIDADGIVRTYRIEAEPEDVEETSAEERGWAEISTYRRRGNELRFVSMWLSHAEQERRRTRAAAERVREAWNKQFKATDPLYLEYKRQLEDPSLSPEDGEWSGVTHEHWCPPFKGSEKRWGRRIVQGALAVELEWALETGPIKLEVYKDGKRGGEQFFDHSAEGMREAFAFAKGLVTGATVAVSHPWTPQSGAAATGDA